MAELPTSARRVADALAAAGITTTIVVLEHAVPTSAAAATAVGCDVGQIAKSLVFTVNSSPFLVIASGANRVDELKLEKLAGGKVRRADPETVKQATGYAIGGVPPLGHPAPLPVYVDADLLQYGLIYAAAGVPECVFPLTPAELVQGTGGRVADVKAE